MVFDIAHGIPVAGFTGINGAGKTTLAVQSAIADMIAGRPVYSTVQITAELQGRTYSSTPIVSLRQLLELRDCTVLLDDVSVIFSARSTSSLPAEMVAFLQVLRHRGITLRWTAPEWMRCDTLIRGITQALVNVVPLLRVRDGSPWPRPRLVMAGVLDTSVGKADAAPTKVLRRRVVVPRRLAAWGAYDTLADTPLIGRNAVGGSCVDCGGSRERPKHTRERHELLGLPWYDGDPLEARPRVGFPTPLEVRSNSSAAPA